MTTKIDDYDVMFTMRTGVTILLPKISSFDGQEDGSIYFAKDPANTGALLISAGDNTITLENLKPDYLDESIERGFIMFYEMENDEVIRCTPCPLKK